MTKRYTDETLVKGEKVLLNNRQSKWVKYESYMLVVSPFIMFLAGTIGEAGMFGFAVMTVLGGIFLLAGLQRILAYHFTEFAVTNKKVLAKSGIISRGTDELQLKKIEGVDVRQGVIDRMLGMGDIILSGTGSQKVVFAGIDNPLAVKKLIDSRI